MISDPIHNSWTIARSAILTHQHRLSVTSNNIANIDTPGYTRRVVHLGTAPETPSNIYQVRDYSKGVGVTVADVVRAQNHMLQNLLRQQTADATGHRTRGDALAGLEALMREDGDSSLGMRLDAFWNSWYDLSNQADNVGFRSVVIQRGVELAAHMNALYSRIDSYEQQILGGVPGNYSGQLPADINHFNRLTEELQDLNARISYSLGGFEPHALMDRRDVLLTELSQFADVSVSPDGAVSLDGEVVVSANGNVRAVLEISNAGPPPTFELDGAAVNITSGALAAWADVLDIAAGMRDRLDILAADLMNAVNELHNSDLNPDGDTYDLNGNRVDWDFFTGVGASDMAVNALIYDPANPLDMDPYLVAAATSRFDVGVPNPGDGSLALQIADLATQNRAALNNQNFNAYHTTGLSLLGGLIQTELALADDGDAIINSLKDQLQAEIGVNMDEELMDMVLAQRAFQAAARLLQVVDELMVTIIQR